MNSDPTSLDRLHDIVVPPPVSWWPPALGWYYVIVLVLLLVLVLAIRGFIRWQRNRYRREALAEFARPEKQLHDPAQLPGALAGMAALLKRAAVTAFPRGEVAALTGPPWFAFLDRTGRTTVFSRGGGAKLEGAAYDPRDAGKLNEAEARVLAQRVKHWLKHHHTSEFEQKIAKDAKSGSDDSASRSLRPSVQNGLGESS